MSQATSRPCRSCGVLVVDLEHVRTLRKAPIEVETDPGGNIGINLLDGTYMVLNKVQLEEARAAGRLLHFNHFAKCPQAPSWQRTEAPSVA